MKANELMIGDWVRFTNGIAKVHDIGKIIGVEFIDGGYDVFKAEELKSIPLTPEILEKNGFEKVLEEDGIECYRYYNSAADGYIKISLYYGGDGDWSIEIVNYEKLDNNKIVYNNNFVFLKVHQLQHALKLCKIGKEIKL